MVGMAGLQRACPRVPRLQAERFLQTGRRNQPEDHTAMQPDMSHAVDARAVAGRDDARIAARTDDARIAARFEIPYTAFLDRDGTVLRPLPPCASDLDEVVRAYRSMVLMRQFDRKAIALQRTGRMGTYASMLGKEAIDAAVGLALAPDDVLLPSYRESGVLLLRGVPLFRTLAYWGGDERGNAYPDGSRDFPYNVPIASQLPHAAGVALAIALRHERRVALAMCGDGATSKGDFHEALNAAGVWRLPLVVVVSNNQYAISMPRHAQSAAATLAQKAIGAGIPGEQVDGNDYFAVRDALDRALARARDGGGATLIEALTYRLGDHTTADDASRYRPPEELAAHWPAEPLRRLRIWLVAAGAWSREHETALAAECGRIVDAEVERYLALPAPAAAEMFVHLHAHLPDALRWQAEASGANDAAAAPDASDDHDASGPSGGAVAALP